MDLRRFFVVSRAKPNRSRVRFWLGLSLAFGLIYGGLALRAAFSSKYVVQDDARMYVFWLQRFIDPNLMPHDLNVAYHESIAPSGYTALYWLMAKLGIQPLFLSKVLPIILILITTVYAFRFCLEIFPVPVAAFTASLLLNQGILLKDDIVSATPRAFIYPLFLAFFYYLLRGSVLAVGVTVGLLGLFYPPIMFIAVVILILRLCHWKKGRLMLTRQRRNYLLCAFGLGAAGLAILPFVLTTSEFGPLVTVAQAKTWPEFAADGGRIPYFTHNAWKFWNTGIHSSFRLSFNPPIVAIAFLLPLMRRFPARFPLAKRLNQNIVILTQILIASLILFFAAHILLFRLFLPSRYMAHSVLIILAIGGGIAICILLEAILSACAHWRRRQGQLLGLGVCLVVGITLIAYPHIFWKDFAKSGYFVGKEPELYAFFQHQPKDILIASLADEVNNLPVFAERSILVGSKYAIPYHVGYYTKIRQRANDLIQAQYSPNLADVQSFIHKYGINFWLVEQNAFTPDYLNNRWLKLFRSADTTAKNNLLQHQTPVLAQRMPSCTLFKSDNYVVLQAKCLTEN